jgi:predicted transcriptional regulator
MNEIKVTIRSFDEVFDAAIDFAQSYDLGKDLVQHSEVSFESLELLLATLTPRRWVLLRELRKCGPTSIRSLSVRLRRDYKAVHTDVAALIDNRLIERSDDMLISVPWDRISGSFSLDQQAA